MKWLVSADLHLTDRPKDDHRFGLFKWLAEQQKKHDVTATFVLGDLTDKKDNHSSTLVNRIIEELLRLKPPIYVLMGNHDYLEHTNPFFNFINHIHGIEFVAKPVIDHGMVMIPHQRDQAAFEAVCKKIPQNGVVLCHQTFSGAIAETGGRLNGFSTSPIEAAQPRLTLAGDIHRPQVVNCVTYVGSPYHVRFGDGFEPRVLLASDHGKQDLHFPCLRKWALRINSAEEIGFHGEKRGDQVKLTIALPREEVCYWASHKQAALDVCKDHGLDVFGIDLEEEGVAKRLELKDVKSKAPEEILTEFCKSEKVSSLRQEAGFELLRG